MVPFVVHHNGLSRTIGDRQTHCGTCDNISYIGAQMSDHDIAVAASIREIDGLLPPAELRRIREKYRLKQADMEQILGTGAKTWTRWERGKITQTKPVDMLIRLLDRNPSLMLGLVRERGIVNQAVEDTYFRMQSGYKLTLNNSQESQNQDKNISFSSTYGMQVSAATPSRIRLPEVVNA
ncbi:MAG: type II toxin-antitoxin system MqsA family antitoxin [Proteobacteria bacterium]|nr:type II toxin-antitoxin system MqsA family antitoxin [Pseudomonadota bacterium]